MGDKRISELTRGSPAELDASSYFVADVGVSTPGTGQAKKYSQPQLSQALLARGALAEFIQNIKSASSIFKGYYGVNAPNDPAIQVDYIWWRGSGEIPKTFPAPLSDFSVWNGGAWVSPAVPYTPDAFDRIADINNGTNYFWSPSASSWVIDTVAGDGVNISANSIGKLYLIDASIGMGKLEAGVQAAVTNALKKTGGAMTGALRLIEPADGAEAARLVDVKNAVGGLMGMAPETAGTEIVQGGANYRVGDVIGYANTAAYNAMVSAVDGGGAVVAAVAAKDPINSANGSGAVLRYAPIGYVANGKGWLTPAHNQSEGRGAADAHPMSAITGLVDWATDVNALMAGKSEQTALETETSRAQGAEADLQTADRVRRGRYTLWRKRRHTYCHRYGRRKRDG
jgi:hypothetical protein